jgi:hypothetical protein
MKQTFKNYFKLGVLLFGISLSLVNCQKDDDISKIDDIKIKTKEFRFTIKNQSEINKDIGYTNAIKRIANIKNKVKKSSTQLRTVMEDEYNFTIIESTVNTVEINGLTSYSMMITRNEETPNSVENLVVQIDEFDNIKAFIIKYSSISIYNQGHTSYGLGRDIEITPIVYNTSVSTNSKIVWSCSTLFELTCSGGNNGDCNGNGTHTPGLQCFSEYNSCIGLEQTGQSCGYFDNGSSTTVTQNGDYSTGGGGEPDSDSIIIAPVICLNCIEECSSDLAIALITNRLTTLSPEQLGYIENSDNCEQTKALQDYLAANLNNTAAEQFALQALEALINGQITNEEYLAVLAEPYIIIGPEAPIVDMVDFLECFDNNAPAEFTIYATEPNPGSGDANDGTFCGHTFVSLSQGNNTATYGYYPTSNWIGPLNTSSSAVIGNDGSAIGAEQYTVSVTIQVSGSQLQQIINASTNFEAAYDLNTYNCTDFAIELGNLGGMSLPECNGTWPLGGGSNPGALGLHIRDNISTGTNTNVGVAPESNKDC